MSELLLHIEGSPRKERSHSIKVANEFIRCYREGNPSAKTDLLDVWSYPLPEFNGAAINAKYKVTRGEKHTPEEATAWKRITAIFEQFNSADKYVFSVPMWNFGIPYKLKHLIDIINQPSLSFSYSAETASYTGLVTGKPAVVIYSRGGAYSKAPAEAFDLQKKYFDLILGFMGFKSVKSIVVEPTMAGPEATEKAMKDAFKQAAKIAKNF